MGLFIMDKLKTVEDMDMVYEYGRMGYMKVIGKMVKPMEKENSK